MAYVPPSPPPGWYPDPATGAARFWDGARWGAFWAPPTAPGAPGPGYYGAGPTYYGPYPAKPSTTAAVFAHLGIFLFGIFLALILYLSADKNDVFTRGHAREALNFQLTYCIIWIGATIVAVVLGVVTLGFALIVIIPAMVAMFVVGIVWAIKAAIAAGSGQSWKYPICFRFVS